MGIIFDIQRFCLHDGPGIRTTVFFKGCNLHCKWCHNPESLKSEKQLSYKKSLCSFCGECARVCTNNVHDFSNKIHKVNFDKCMSCGKCISVCMTNALNIIGYEASAEEMMETIIKDIKYYNTSGGGLTASGGEATMQFDFLSELFTLAKKQNIHTCIETNGIINKEKLINFLPLVDLFLVDYKHYDKEELKKYTGADLEILTETLSILNLHNKPVILRCPIIPDINDKQEHYDAIEEIKKNYKNILKHEIMPYHDTWKDKLESIQKTSH